MTRRRLVAAARVVAFALAASLSFTARAEPKPGPNAEAASEAKHHFDVGLKLYAEHAYQEALAEFEASYRLGGRVSALKNIAQCHRDLKHFADAYVAYERMLSEHGAQLKPDEIAVVKRALDELGVLTATLTVSASEAGATIDLDGREIGVTPLPAPKRIALGAHSLKLTKPGFEPFTKEIAASSEQKIEVDAPLAHEVTTGHVSVREQDGDPVNVIVDGIDEGPAPWNGELPPGEHTLEARGPKFVAPRRTFSVVRREQLDLAIDATTTLGRLHITTVPASASIALDGAAVGTGSWEADVAVGPHTVVVSVPGAPSAVRHITVARGEVVAQEIPVAPSGGIAPGTEYRGLYARLSPIFLVDLHPKHTVAANPADTSVSGTEAVTPNFAFGVGGTLRVGYSLDVLAFELAALFMGTHFDDDVSFNGGTNTHGSNNLSVTSIYTALGVGPRVTSHDSSVRFTAGGQVGVAIRSIKFSRGANGSGNSGGSASSFTDPGFDANAGYTDPALMFDAGFLLGSTPGTKLYVGAQAVIDFPKSIAVGPDTSSSLPNGYFASPGRGYLLVQGPQFFLGPVLGLQFGR